MLLARHQESIAMSLATVAQLPARPVVITSMRVRSRKRPASRPQRGRWTLVLDTVAVLALVLVASLAANRLIEGLSTPNHRMAINAASTPVSDATPGTDTGNPVLLWAASKVGSGAGFARSQPGALAIGPNGNIYVLDRLANKIKVFAPSGSSLGTWPETAPVYGSGTPVAGVASDPGFYTLALDGFYGSGGGIGFDADQNLYVVDSGNSRILKFDSEGNYLAHWQTPGVCKPGRHGATSGTVDRINGRVYLADQRNDCVQVYDLNGKLLESWGRWGVGNGQFISPESFAIASDGSVYISELSSGRIQHFAQDGTWLDAFGGPAPDPEGNSRGSAGGLAFDAHGNLIVVGVELPDGSVDYTSWQGTIWVYGPDGTELARFTEVDGYGSLGNLSDVAVAPDGSIYLTTSDGPQAAYLSATRPPDLLHIMLPDLTGS
jgi:sugar lactone lactonase YvrE